MINWKCKPYVPTEEQYISWCTDYKSYLDKKSNNLHTNTEYINNINDNTENTNYNTTSTTTNPHTDNENTKDSKDNTENTSDNNCKRT